MAVHYLEYRGCRLAYKVQGDGEPIVFIQGTAVHGDGWQPQIDFFKTNFSCLSFDNRGMSKSQPLGEALSVDLMAADTLALMQHLGWQKAHVVGHSLGGLIALAFATHYPENTKSLSLLCTFSNGAEATKVNPWLLQIGLRMRVGPAKYRRRAFVDMVMPPMKAPEKDSWAKKLEPVFGYDLAKQPSIVNHQLKAMTACDMTSQLNTLVTVPSMVMTAEHDKIAPPRFGKALAEQLSAPYNEIKNAAHGVTISHADDVNKLLLEHFRAVG